MVYFIINSAGTPFSDDRTMKAAQLHLNYAKEKSDLNLATGIYSMNDMPDLPDNVISISMRDYHISVSTLRYTFKSNIPISIGTDFISNFKDYSTDSALVANNLADQTRG